MTIQNRGNDQDHVSEDIMAPAGLQPLTPRCKRYTSPSDMPPELAKYWAQRRDLFRLYDEAEIYMTDDAWFGVTAEPIADAIAAELHHKGLQRHSGAGGTPPPRVVVDLFAGAGGNTIALARAGHWDLVVGIEIDPATLACAQRNAAAHGLGPDRIRWVRGDCLDFLDRLRTRPWALHPDLRLVPAGLGRRGGGGEGRAAGGDGEEARLGLLARDVQLFASPPWGGPQYSGAAVMDLEAMEPYGVELLHRAMAPMAHGLFLPRNGDLRQLADLVPDSAREKLDVVQYCINGGSKGIVAYFPADEAYENSSDIRRAQRG